MATINDERSLGELFASLSKDTTTLVRKEIELAKTEVLEKVTEAGKNVVALVVGGLVAYTALIFILAAIAVGLTAFMEPWLGVLLVGVVVALISFILVQKGLSSLKNMSWVPKQTIETLKEDKEWVQQQVK